MIENIRIFFGYYPVKVAKSQKVLLFVSQLQNVLRNHWSIILGKKVDGAAFWDKNENILEYLATFKITYLMIISDMARNLVGNQFDTELITFHFDLEQLTKALLIVFQIQANHLTLRFSIHKTHCRIKS